MNKPIEASSVEENSGPSEILKTKLEIPSGPTIGPVTKSVKRSALLVYLGRALFPSVGAIVTITILLLPLLVEAHSYPKLNRAVPAPESILAESPQQLCIEFTALVEKQFSEIVLYTSGDARPVSLGDREWQSSKQLCVGLPLLESSVYRVHWSVVSRDGHRTQGDYQFTVE